MKNILVIMPMLSMVGQAKSGGIIANELAKIYNVTVVTFNQKTKSDHEYSAKVIYLNNKLTLNPFLRAFKFFDRIYQIRKLKKELQITHSLSFGESGNYINILSQIGEKVIISTREHKSQRFIYDNSKEAKVHKFLMKSLYKFSNIHISQTKSVELDMINSFNINKNSSKIIPNPYDIDEIEKLKSEEIEAEIKDLFIKSKILISVGRVSKQKGQWHLVEIFEDIKKEIDNIKLVFIGDFEEIDVNGNSLKNYISDISKNLKVYKFWNNQELNSNYDIYFLGYRKNHFKYTSKADIFLFPSFWEGFPNALVEAMSCGVAVISSDCKSGPREILAPNSDFEFQTKKIEFAEFGILNPLFSGDFENQNSEVKACWIESIKKLLNDEDLRVEYAKKAKMRANDFSKEKIVKEWIEIIEN